MDYGELSRCYEKIDGTSKRLEKTYYISEFLKKIDPADIDAVILLLQGRIFPSWSQQKIGIADKLVLKAISISTGLPQEDLQESWKTIGDLGDVAAKSVASKQQATLFSTSLSIAKVFANAQKIATMEGSGSTDRKIKLIAELLTSATPVEAKYIVRMVLEDLRVGIGEGSLRDAICWAYIFPVTYDKEKNYLVMNNDKREKYKEHIAIVQEALDLTNDFSRVLKVAKHQGKQGLKELSLTPGNPIKVMLYQRAQNVKEALERLGTPCAFDHKVDGFRLQIHKEGGVVTLFTRRLEEVTKQFPEIVEFVSTHVRGNDFILDSEAVGYDPVSKERLPFQYISQRIRRKHNIAEMVKKFPVELNVFDILYYNEKSLVKKGFVERRQLLESITAQEPGKVVLVKSIITDDLAVAQKFYQEALAEGQEGLMGKKLDAIYKPGSRVGYGVKIKSVMDPLDLVVVKAEWGEGKRAGWFTSFTVACNDHGELREIGKVGTGFKEKEEGVTFAQMTELLQPLITKEEGREVFVKASLVISLKFEEIQKSPTYSSGYALRFPRMMFIREEKPVEDIATLDEVHERFLEQ